MIRFFNVAALALVMGLVGIAQTAKAEFVTINSNTFDLDQFSGAAVTYRPSPPGDVDFAGKTWDNVMGVDGYTLGELAAGQYGGDPGDQITLQDRTTPDWFTLTYSSGITILPGAEQFIVYEISSAISGVDPEGTSFQVQFNGMGPWFQAGNASVATATFFPSAASQNTNQIVFNLLDAGFAYGDSITSITFQNLDSGSETSDPDFIFAGVTAATVPEPTSVILLGMGSIGFGWTIRRYRQRSERTQVS